MHLALVTAYPPSKGSLNEYGFHFARAFAGNREVERLSIIGDVLEPGVEDEESTTLGGASEVHRVWRFNDPRNAWKIARKLDELSPDGVIFTFQFASFGDKRIPAALGLLAPWLSARKRPTITLLHNIFETVDLAQAGFGGNPIMEAITRTAGRIFTRAVLKSDLVAFTLPRYVDIIRERYGARNVFLAPHGTFEVPDAPAPLPEQPTVMTFGKFGTYKKVEVLLEAHAALLERDPRVRLVIAGSDSPNAKGYLADVQQRYAHLPNVTFTGYVAEEDVPKVFRDCTVVAFPYESTTGSSGVLHQAGQYGRAAVMPKIGDLADLIEEEGYRAEYFTPGDVASLTETLWQVLAQPERAAELGMANYRAATGLLLADVADWYLLHLERLARRSWRSNSFETAVERPTS